MLVSIIVPVYNVEKYLRQCLDSILAQTYKKLEVILVDDGSKDDSGKICDEYGENYDNFYVIHKENAGLGMARNTGMEHMHGEYVTFLDSDDYLDSTLIECLLKGLQDSTVDMCKGGFRRVTDKKRIKAIVTNENRIYPGGEALSLMLPKMIGSRPNQKDSIEMCVCGSIYKSSLIWEHKLRFPSERELISEDLVFNIDYMQYANGACTIEHVGYNYRFTKGSLTTNYRPNRFKACKHFYLEINKQLKLLSFDEMTLLRLRRMFFIHIRMCIVQEKTKVSGHNHQKAIKNIKNICNDEILQQIIEEYPVNQLGIPQRIFLKLIRNHMAGTLLLLAELGIV